VAKGKLGMLLIGEPKEDKEDTKSEGAESEEADTASATLDTAAEELVGAIAKKDKAAVAEALRSAFTACREMK
jgi:hypothetical protein